MQVQTYQLAMLFSHHRLDLDCCLSNALCLFLFLHISPTRSRLPQIIFYKFRLTNNSWVWVFLKIFIIFAWKLFGYRKNKSQKKKPPIRCVSSYTRPAVTVTVVSLNKDTERWVTCTFWLIWSKILLKDLFWAWHWFMPDAKFIVWVKVF